MANTSTGILGKLFEKDSEFKGSWKYVITILVLQFLTISIAIFTIFQFRVQLLGEGEMVLKLRNFM